MPAFRTIRLSIRRGCLVFATGGGQLFFFSLRELERMHRDLGKFIDEQKKKNEINFMAQTLAFLLAFAYVCIKQRRSFLIP